MEDNKQDKKEQEQVKITNDELVPIKAVSKEGQEKHNKNLEARLDNIEIHRRQKKIEPSKEKQLEALSKVKGSVVVGKLTEEEIRAVASNDLGALKRAGLKRMNKFNRRK